mmetsp:Transcript_38394/g.113865  ORF Transcript_38394/g.113865 Transcript_38394/m.113865 type:complete len:293 (-) Transcript_38394:889-1767(-)
MTTSPRASAAASSISSASSRDVTAARCCSRPGCRARSRRAAGRCSALPPATSTRSPSRQRRAKGLARPPAWLRVWRRPAPASPQIPLTTSPSMTPPMTFPQPMLAAPAAAALPRPPMLAVPLATAAASPPTMPRPQMPAAPATTAAATPPAAPQKLMPAAAAVAEARPPAEARRARERTPTTLGTRGRRSWSRNRAAKVWTRYGPSTSPTPSTTRSWPRRLTCSKASPSSSARAPKIPAGLRTARFAAYRTTTSSASQSVARPTSTTASSCTPTCTRATTRAHTGGTSAHGR